MTTRCVSARRPARTRSAGWRPPRGYGRTVVRVAVGPSTRVRHGVAVPERELRLVTDSNTERFGSAPARRRCGARRRVDRSGRRRCMIGAMAANDGLRPWPRIRDTWWVFGLAAAALGIFLLGFLVALRCGPRGCHGSLATRLLDLDAVGGLPRLFTTAPVPGRRPSWPGGRDGPSRGAAATWWTAVGVDRGRPRPGEGGERARDAQELRVAGAHPRRRAGAHRARARRAVGGRPALGRGGGAAGGAGAGGVRGGGAGAGPADRPGRRCPGPGGMADRLGGDLRRGTGGGAGRAAAAGDGPLADRRAAARRVEPAR